MNIADQRINKLITDEIEMINMSYAEKDLIYSLLGFEMMRSNKGKIEYQKEYIKQLGDTITKMSKK